MLKVLFASLFGSAVGAGGVWLWLRLGTGLAAGGMSYTDLAATLLAAVSVLLAVLGFFIAILALFGWTQFRGMARSAAKGEIKAQMDGGDLRTYFELMVKELFTAHLKSSEFRKFMKENLDLASYGSFQETVKGEARDDDED